MDELKKRYEQLKEEQNMLVVDYHSNADITEKLESYIQLYDALTVRKGEQFNTNTNRDRDIVNLLEKKLFNLKRRDPENKSKDNRAALSLLSKIIKRKISSSSSGDITRVLSLSAAELLCVSATQTTGPKKKLLLTKAQNLMTSSGLSESISSINEFLEITPPEELKDSELAKALYADLNTIMTLKTDQAQIQALERLTTDIDNTINKDEQIPEDEFTIYHHVLNKAFSMIDCLEPKTKKI